MAAWNAFLEVQTQWRVGGMGGRTGLDYAGVLVHLRFVLRARGEQLADLLRGIQACERAALRTYAEAQPSN